MTSSSKTVYKDDINFVTIILRSIDDIQTEWPRIGLAVLSRVIANFSRV